MPVYGYIRVSTDEQVDGTSLGEQRRTILGLAMAAGLPEPEVVEDRGVSGALPLLARPGGARLAQLGAGDALLVAKLDRFSRNGADALTTIERWEAAGVRLIVGGMGDVIGPAARGSAGRLLLEILAVFAGHERRVLRERQREGQQAKRGAGGHIGGAAPFGYRRVGSGRAARLEPDPEQQAAIPRIREMAASGRSLRAISAALAEGGITISHQGVKRILERG